MKQLKLQPNQKQIIFDNGKDVQILNGISKKVNKLREINVSKNAKLEYYFIWKSVEIKRNLMIHLNESGAEANLMGIFIADDNCKIELNSIIKHHAPNTHGNTFVKGALSQSAKANIKGMIKIDKGADGSEDLLTERVLLLSPQARAEAQPMLEIEANQVKATHAATVSRLNEEQQFYLRSRGLTKIQAKDFIVEGFLQEVVDLFPEAVKGNALNKFKALPYTV